MQQLSAMLHFGARAQRAEKLGGMWLAGRIGQGLANKPNWK